MLPIIISSVVGFISFIALDYLWIGVLTKSFYLKELSSHLALKDGVLAPYLPAVPFVYIVAIIGIIMFALPKAHSLPSAFLAGAILGFIMYAFYDITNLSIFKDYSLAVTLVDIAWGTFLVGAVTTIMFFVKGLVA